MDGSGDPVATPDDDGSLDIDMIASSLQADSGDVRILLKALVSRLAGALGERMRVERTGGGRLRRRPEEIRRVLVNLGDDQLEATVEDGRLECTIARSSGGIRIRSARVGINEWLQHLLLVLRDEAATSQSTRTALEAMLIGDDQ